MKILLINKWVAGATKGAFHYPGTWRDTFELACVFYDLGHQVEILTTKVQKPHLKRFHKEFAAVLAQKGIKHHFASTYVSFGKSFGSFRLRLFFDELSLIRNSKPDIIQYMQFGPSLIYPFVGKTPVIFYTCDQFNHYPKEEEDRQNAIESWGQQKEFKPWVIFQNLLFTIATRLWGSTDLSGAFKRKAIFILKHPKGYKNLKKKFGSDSRIFLIPKAYSSDNIKPVKKRKSNKTRVLFMGQITNRKGVYDLLETMKIVQNKRSFSVNNNPNVELLIAGAGTNIATSRLNRQIAKLGINAKYLGPINFNRKWLLFWKSDIFCLPSYQDSYPSVILEAMASGVPVITTREIDSPIVDGLSGILVKAGDIKSLAAAIEKLASNQNLRQKIGNEGKIAVQDLTWSKQARKLIKLYESFTKSK